jgi:type IV pilus assembly protein PilC
MSKFSYKAKDWNGKLIKGVLDLGSQQEVLESIKSSGLVPLTIKQETQSALMSVYRNIFGKVGLKQVATFTRQLSTMMNSGLALTDALSLLKNQADRSGVIYEMTDTALTTVQGGHTLGEALSKYPKIFSEAYIASINAGEEGGVLEEVLAKLADNLENENEFASKVKGAMIYPVIVIIGMVIVAVIMMVFVIPKLLGLYSEFGSNLPASTRALMAMSNFMQKFWFFIPILVAGGYAFLKVSFQNEKMRLKLDTYKFKIPIFGELTKKNILASTMRTLSMLLGAGISLVEALRIVSKVSGNEMYNQAYIKIAERVQQGFSIANSFEELGIFPPIVNQMVATGEVTGKLDEVLLRVSEYFAAEAEQSVKSLTSAIEPLIMIVLGIGVAFLVVAVIMPIYNLTSQF